MPPSRPPTSSAAIVAADGRLTDGELDAYLDAIGPLLDPPLITTAAHLPRDVHLFDGIDQEWLDGPSVLFDLLVKADGKHGTRRSHRYYELAMRLAHVTAALDLVPSLTELQAIDAFRTTAAAAIDSCGCHQAGPAGHQPRPTPTPAGQTASSCQHKPSRRVDVAAGSFAQRRCWPSWTS